MPWRTCCLPVRLEPLDLSAHSARHESPDFRHYRRARSAMDPLPELSSERTALAVSGWRTCLRVVRYPYTQGSWDRRGKPSY
eukprot:scaffold1638_cov258-Pinguiococcus_pyrenoidosus.AAC.98